MEIAQKIIPEWALFLSTWFISETFGPLQIANLGPVRFTLAYDSWFKKFD